VRFGEQLATQRIDPLLHDIDLPLQAACYPIGFPLRLATNSRDVIEAAAESWGTYTARDFAVPPLDLRFIVQAEPGSAEQPEFRSQGQLFSIVSDRYNYATFDSRTMSGYCFITEETASHHLKLRLHFLEAMVYMLLAQRYVCPMHAACVARDGSGALLCGPSTAGKTTLSYACARAGFTYVADDCTWLLADSHDRMAIGKPHLARFRNDAPRFFPELEGYATRAYPNGKLTIEVPITDFPQIQTARRVPIDRVIMIERRNGRASLERVSTECVLRSLLADMPSYGDEVNEMYTRTVLNLLDVPAYELRYEVLEDAIRLL
jgi:hypothetical protein